VLAAILESRELDRLYTGLSLLVSADDSRALATFGALPLLLDPALHEHALVHPHVIAAEREAFARTLVELREATRDRIWACAAAVQATGTDWALVNERLAGVTSTAQFLRDAGGAQLVVV
jgi:hypothetical protein